MKKRMKMVDLLASVALVGVISATVLGQVGPPTPVGTWCPPGSISSSGGSVIQYDGKWCPPGTVCGLSITVTDDGVIIGAVRVCLTGSGTE